MHYIILAKSNRNIHLLLLHYFIEWFVKYDIEEWWILKKPDKNIMEIWE